MTRKEAMILRNCGSLIPALTILFSAHLSKGQIVNTAPSLAKLEMNGFGLEDERTLEWKTGNAPILTVKGAFS